MKPTIAHSLKLLNLTAPFTLPQLKDAYRASMKQWHPDLNPDRVEEYTRHCQDLNDAYDILERCKDIEAISEDNWNHWVQQRMKDWEKQFRRKWKQAYRLSKEPEPYSGLHLSTCIETFRRGAINPPKHWFLHCLFEDTQESRMVYREHLMSIAPNRKHREEWSRKYFALEFGEGEWVFYLPGAPSLLTSV